MSLMTIVVSYARSQKLKSHILMGGDGQTDGQSVNP